MSEIAVNRFRGPQVGVSDIPLRGDDKDEEKLRIDHYYEGLAEFISKCQTPMTLAIQGSWGSGKTSAIHFIMNKLEGKSTGCLEFNTWQYSQFDLGDQLVFTLLNELGSKLAGKEAGGSKLVKGVKKIFQLAGPQTAGALASLMGVGGAVAPFLNSLQQGFTDDEVPSLANQLTKLREDFQADVKSYLAKNNEIDRVAIFIDDLDRLDPSRAVQLMECLKLFLDIEQCVFILAIDFEIVKQGVLSKFGADTNEIKARSFFDKIIQVPFRMPDGVYDVGAIIEDTLDKFQYRSLNGFDDYVKAARLSVGNNPRSIKRLLNSFNLLRIIMDSHSAPESEVELMEEKLLVLYMLQCAQAAFPKFHDDLSRKVWEDNEAAKDLLITASDESDNDSDYKEWNIDPGRVNSFEEFRGMLGEKLSVPNSSDDSNSDGEDEGKEVSIRLLKDCLGIASVTAVGVGGSDSAGDGALVVGSGLIESLEAMNGLTSPLKSLVKYFQDKLHREFGTEAPVILANPGSRDSRNWVIYMASKVSDIESKSRRLRPKFAEFVFTNNAIEVRFGLSSRRDFIEGHHYSEKWSEIAERIQRDYPLSKEGRRTMCGIERQSGTPLALRYISNQSDVDRAVSILRDAYEIAKSKRESKIGDQAQEPSSV